MNGIVSIEKSTIAPWFGQVGGGIQYRFFDDEEVEMSAGDVKDLKILVDR